MALNANRFLAAGTKFHVYDTTTDPVGYRVSVGIVNIPGPELATDDVEATELDPYQDTITTAAAIQLIKKWVAGWTDLGEIAFEVNMTSQEFAFYLGQQLARNVVYFKIVLRNGYNILIKGYVKGLGANLQVGELAKMPLTIKLTDAIKFVAYGSADDIAWAPA